MRDLLEPRISNHHFVSPGRLRPTGLYRYFWTHRSLLRVSPILAGAFRDLFLEETTCNSHALVYLSTVCAILMGVVASLLLYLSCISCLWTVNWNPIWVN